MSSSSKRGQTNLSFLIAVNKPCGFTSHDIVNKLRKIFGEGRIGHMGTLDPNAEGLMIYGVGSAARLNKYIETCNKEYVATIKFGIKTNTYDIDGEIINKANVPKNILEQMFVKNYLNNLVGSHMQKPPVYSAIKLNGKAAYKYARSNKSIDIPSRQIEIFSADLINILDDCWVVKFRVSKGTYIRSIANDLGDDLGCFACLQELKRTAIGDVSIEESYNLADIDNLFHKSIICYLNPLRLLPFPAINVEEEMMLKINNGCPIHVSFDKIKCVDSENKIMDINKIEHMSLCRDGILAIYKPTNIDIDKKIISLECECKFANPVMLG